MKVQNLRGLQNGDSFKVAGMVHVVMDQLCVSKPNGRRVAWGEACSDDNYELYGMEVTDVVRKRERVTLTFEVLRDDDVVSDFDVGDTTFRLHDLREAGEIGRTAGRACAHSGFSRILRPVKT